MNKTPIFEEQKNPYEPPGWFKPPPETPFKIFFIILGICLFLSLISIPLFGCIKPIYLTAKCPAPTIEPEPHYPVLLQDATPSDFVSWCIVGQKQCRDALKRCNKRLEPYKH